MQSILEAIGNNLIAIIGSIITLVFSYIGMSLKNLYKNSVNDNTKKNIVQSTVNYVEQVGGLLTSSEKFNLAIEKATEWLNERGLKFSDTELEILIENAVKSLKQEY